MSHAMSRPAGAISGPPRPLPRSSSFETSGGCPEKTVGMADFYNTLQDGEIRLLQLQPKKGPSHPDDGTEYPLEGFIKSFTLEAGPPYVALSYCWGTDRPSKHFALNGGHHLLRNNLHRLLRQWNEYQQDNLLLGHASDDSQNHLHSVKPDSDNPADESLSGISQELGKTYLSRSPSLIWTDALCINQNSMPEKTAQLEMLRDIYGKANRIIIWLGESDESSNRAINTWRRLARTIRNDPQDSDGLNLSMDDCRALKNIGDRHYWRRVWIWQEASTPQVKRELWCGNERIPFEDAVLGNSVARHWLLHLNRMPQINPWNTELEDLNILSHLRQIQGRFEGANSSWSAVAKGWDSLTSMLYTTLDLQATNPRDKIYALLPVYADIRNVSLHQLIRQLSRITSEVLISSESGEKQPGKLLRVDYDQPLENLYENTAIFMLAIENDLRALLLCTLTAPRVSLHSWVPNFKNMSRRFNLFDYHDLFDAMPGTTPQVTMSIKRKRATIRGIDLDTVTSVHPPLATTDSSLASDSTDIDPARLYQWLDSFAKFIYPDTTDRSYLGTIGLSEAVDRLLALHCAPGLVLERSDSVTHWPIRAISTGAQILPTVGLNARLTDLFLRTNNASVFWTRNGYLGLGDPSVRQNDHIVLFDGLSIPMTLRPMSLYNWIVGPCYVQGVMDGEFKLRGYRPRNFDIY